MYHGGGGRCACIGQIHNRQTSFKQILYCRNYLFQSLVLNQICKLFAYLTSKPSQHHRRTFKPDLTGSINFDMLITKIISIYPDEFGLSSTSASKFCFVELENGRAARTEQSLQARSYNQPYYQA